MELKNKIKEIRKRLHLTQEKFAEELGIETGYIGHIEMGLRQPGRKTINRICTIFKIDPREFFETEKKPVIKKEDSRIVSLKKLPERKKNLILNCNELMNDMDEEGIRDILKHIEKEKLWKKARKKKRKTA